MLFELVTSVADTLTRPPRIQHVAWHQLCVESSWAISIVQLHFWPLGVTACCEGGSSTSGCVGGVEHSLVFTASELSPPCFIADWIIVGTHKVSGLLLEAILYG